MKKILSFLMVMSGLSVKAQLVGTRVPLTGYFIVSCFEESLKSGCTLDIATIKAVDGDSMTCGDGVFYKNISSITYVGPKELNLRYVDDFDYQIKLQSRQHQVYLSTNPLILRAAGSEATALRRNMEVINAIKQNQLTASLLQYQVDSLHMDFTRKRHRTVLMSGTLLVLVLPDRVEPKTYKTPLGYHQYLLLQDKSNKIRFARALKDPF